MESGLYSSNSRAGNQIAMSPCRFVLSMHRISVEDYNDPPSVPLVEGTASALRGSISTAWRKLLAKPL